ncbi:MAG: hypothetical protein QM270_10350 [Bacillota bacterium]|nr:hypothetical protein [Bacillota bacterium]
MNISGSAWLTVLVTWVTRLTYEPPAKLDLSESLAVTAFSVLVVFLALASIWLVVAILGRIMQSFHKPRGGA